MRRVANKTRSRKVHSAVFFRGRQERPKSSSHGPKVRSEIAFFTPKTPCFSAAKPRSREGTALPSPKITRQSSGSILRFNPQVQSSGSILRFNPQVQSSGSILRFNPQVQSSAPSRASDRTYLNSRHTTTTQLRPTKKTMDAMTPMNQSIVVGRKWSGKVADQPRGHPFRVPKPVCNRKTCTRPHPF